MNTFCTSYGIPRGYIAVVSAIILSVILTALMLGESLSVFWSRYDQLDQEASVRSSLLSQSCLYEALLQYVEDPTQLKLQEKIRIGSDTCVITPFIFSSSGDVLSSFALQRNSLVRSFVTISRVGSSGILKATSWRDITSTPP